MSDALKEKIWDLVAPLLVKYTQERLYVERLLLENAVLDLFQDIEEEIDLDTTNAFHNGYRDGFAEADDSISELQDQIQCVIESLRDTADRLERECKK